MTDDRLPLSTHQILDFMGCPRIYKNRHVVGRVPITTTESLRIGKLWHRMMERWWAKELNGETSTARFLEAERLLEECEDEFERSRLGAMIAGYSAMWSGDRHRWKTVEVEYPFAVPIVHPETGHEHPYFVLTGTIDKLIEDEKGNLYLGEHKTSSDASDSSDYWKRLALDSQVSNYYIGSVMSGKEIVGCLYDVTQKPMLRQYKATPKEKRKYTRAGAIYAGQHENDETPKEFFDRIAEVLSRDPSVFFMRRVLLRLEQEIERAQWDLWDIACMIQSAHEEGAFPRNTKACRKPSGAICEYFEPCTGTGSLTDGTRFKDNDYKPGGIKLTVVGNRPDPLVGF